MSAYHFDTDFMRVDPFQGREPWNRVDIETEAEPIMCHCCDDVQVKSEGDLCAACYADYLEHIND